MRRIVLIGASPGMGVALTRAGVGVLTQADVVVEPPAPKRIDFDAELARAAAEFRYANTRSRRERRASDERSKRHEWLQSLRRRAGGY